MEMKRNQFAYSLLLVVVGLIFALCLFGCSGTINSQFTTTGNGEGEETDNEEPGDGNENTDDKTFDVNVTFTFNKPEDEKVGLDKVITLSAVEKDVLELEAADGYDSYEWKYIVDSVTITKEGKSLTIYAEYFPIGVNYVSLKVEKDGIPYTKSIYFTVY